MHVRRYNRNANSRGYRVTGKLQGGSQILGTIVNSRKKMTMKVDHARSEEYPLL
jgi:hypothetical protein